MKKPRVELAGVAGSFPGSRREFLIPIQGMEFYTPHTLTIKPSEDLWTWKNVIKGAQAWDIRSHEFSWFLRHKVFMGMWFGGKNINLLF